MGWRRFLRRAQWDRERAKELESCLQIETDENIARGMSAAEAGEAAQKKLGNTLRIREEIYQMNTIGFLDSLGRDLLYALRAMRHKPHVHGGRRADSRARHWREHRSLQRPQ